MQEKEKSAPKNGELEILLGRMLSPYEKEIMDEYRIWDKESMSNIEDPISERFKECKFFYLTVCRDIAERWGDYKGIRSIDKLMKIYEPSDIPNVISWN
ncbi:hypothetical protein KY366_08455 [Candidatus Woesearchaeota archaeon]|nr:hypothetical protein [Candidatus Woesearchaeota archaeon]